MSVGASRVAAAARRGPLDALESVRAALGFLTRFPAGSRHGTVATSATGAAAFGFVGALVGAAGAVPMLLVGGLEPTVGAILAVMAVAVASGALHLDGLADTADALLVPDPARAEAARTDPATGPGGVVAVVLVLGLDVAALSALAAAAGPGIAALACIAAGSASRAVAVVASLAMRPSAAGRLGRWFAERLGTADAVMAVASTVAIVGLVALVSGQGGAGAALALGTAVGAAVGLAASWLIVARRGQLDGDGLGASIEVGFAAVLVGAALAADILRTAGVAT